MYGGRKKKQKSKNKKTTGRSEDQIVKAIKGTIISDIKNLFEQEEYYHKLVTVGNFVSKSNSDRNKTLNNN